MTAGTFVAVPAERMLGELRRVGAAIRTKHGTFVESVVGREIVIDFAPSHGRSAVRVYTSLSVGEDQVRDVAADAVRVVVGVTTPEGWRTILPPKHLHRTAPRTAADRPGAFLERLVVALRAAYAAALRSPVCPDCGRTMALRGSERGSFWGCLGFPECRRTMPRRDGDPELSGKPGRRARR